MKTDYYARMSQSSGTVQLTPEINVLTGDRAQYFNGFQVAIGAGDILLNLTLNGQPVVTLNSSFTIAKSLGDALSQTVKVFEASTKHQILTVEDIKKSRSEIDKKAAEISPNDR